MNLKKLPRSFPCKCGHRKDDHDDAGPPIGEEWCNGLDDFFCDCYSYIPDNLKLLELAYRKSKRKKK